MNVWLFSSFLSNTTTQIFGGIIGAMVDLFKLYSLHNFDHGIRIRSVSKAFIKFPLKSLLYYIFFLIVSAGASLLFGLIDIDKSIARQHTGIGGVSRTTLERQIKNDRKGIEDLLDFEDLNRMSKRVVADTNRLLLSSGVLKIDYEKKVRRKKAEKIELRLSQNEKLLDQIIENSKGTFEAFDYFAQLLPGAGVKMAKIIFLALIITSIELLTGECRAAMSALFTSIEIKKKKSKATVKKASSPITGGAVYNSRVKKK
jgi:hypothetical protein